MKTFIISDVHGLFDELKQSLDLAGFVRNEDRLVFLGDYINAYAKDFSESMKILDFLVEVANESDRHVFLKGNHESMLLGAAAGHNYSKSLQLWNAIRDEHAALLRNRLTPVFEGDGWIAIHDADKIDINFPYQQDISQSVIISGHQHLRAPVVRYRRVAMAGDERVYVLNIDRRIIHDDQGRQYDVAKAWK